MHKRKKPILFFLTLLIFRCFFITTLQAEHVEITVNLEKYYKSKIVFEVYDRKYLFEDKAFPIFIKEIRTYDKTKSYKVDLSSIPHKYVGIFVYLDINDDNKFTLDFKGEPSEPFGFSLNPNMNYSQTHFEDIVFDMSLYKQPFEIFLKDKLN